MTNKLSLSSITFVLPSPVNLDVHPFPNQNAETINITLSSLTFRQALDNPVYKQVSVTFYELRNQVIIWDGDSYDSAGEWTQNELLSAISDKISKNAEDFVKSGFEFKITQEQRSAISQRVRAFFPKGIPTSLWIPPTNPQGSMFVSALTAVQNTPRVQPQNVPAP